MNEDVIQYFKKFCLVNVPNEARKIQANTHEMYLMVRYIERKENIICYSSKGREKTHLLTAAGIKTCELGYKIKTSMFPHT